MPGKGDFGRRRENSHPVTSVIGRHRRHEGRFGAVRLCRQQLHRLIGQDVFADDHGEWVTGVGSLGKDIHQVEATLHVDVVAWLRRFRGQRGARRLLRGAAAARSAVDQPRGKLPARVIHR